MGVGPARGLHQIDRGAAQCFRLEAYLSLGVHGFAPAAETDEADCSGLQPFGQPFHAGDALLEFLSGDFVGSLCGAFGDVCHADAVVAQSRDWIVGFGD